MFRYDKHKGCLHLSKNILSHFGENYMSITMFINSILQGTSLTPYGCDTFPRNFTQKLSKIKYLKKRAFTTTSSHLFSHNPILKTISLALGKRHGTSKSPLLKFSNRLSFITIHKKVKPSSGSCLVKRFQYGEQHARRSKTPISLMRHWYSVSNWLGYPFEFVYLWIRV